MKARNGNLYRFYADALKAEVISSNPKSLNFIQKLGDSGRN
jgi:hypothetical protein